MRWNILDGREAMRTIVQVIFHDYVTGSEVGGWTIKGSTNLGLVSVPRDSSEEEICNAIRPVLAAHGMGITYDPRGWVETSEGYDVNATEDGFPFLALYLNDATEIR